MSLSVIYKYIICQKIVNTVIQHGRKSCYIIGNVNYNQKRWVNTDFIAPDDRGYKLGDFSDDIQPYLKKKKTRELETNKIDRTNQTPIIKCKHTQLNHYRDQVYNKFDQLPLASKGWTNRKSKGDYFTIDIHNKGYIPNEKDYGTFKDTGLDPRIVDILEKKDIKVPSEIQVKGITALLSRQNTILAAETGCGKTLAFLAPLVHQILQWKGSGEATVEFNSPIGLIITPSRELSEQILEICRWFSELSINSKLILGGDARNMIENPSFEEVDILVATIGIVSKLTNIGIYTLNNVRHVILDEADSLLDDSFSDLLVHFLSKIRIQSNPAVAKKYPSTQMTLVSATMPTSVPDTLGGIINVEKINRVTSQRLHHVMPNVKQVFIRLGRTQKPAHLLSIMKKKSVQKSQVIIFCNKIKTCDFVATFLNDNNIEAVSLSGVLKNKIRSEKFQDFQSGKLRVLVCTDVASRGLDTKMVEHIINYDFPMFAADYIHRCGRTGRLGSNINGLVTNFVSGVVEIKLVQKIETAARLTKSIENVNANIKRIITHKFNNWEQTNNTTELLI